MTRSPRFWRVATALFNIINLLGAVWAVWAREPAHAALHVVLLVAGYVVWRRAPWERKQDAPQEQLAAGRIEYLQQSVDAVALEVERLGEAQRFHEKLRAERGKNTDGER